VFVLYSCGTNDIGTTNQVEEQKLSGSALKLQEAVTKQTSQGINDFPKIIALEDITERRAKRLLFQALNLKNTRFADALEFLVKEGVRCDPQHAGVMME